jgi:energy-coupling factor transport system substrate-specific component
MKQISVKTIVAIGIGAALFFVLSTYIAIPTPIPNLKISLHYPVIGVMAMIFGPLAGCLMALIGHFLSDLAGGWGIWWSWIAGSAFFGLMMGYVGKKIRIEEGEFATKEMIFFNISQAIIHLISWGLIAPALDILIYSEPANKVFIQGAAGSIGNIVSTAIVGTILCATYASTRAKKGSLKLEEE